jgi:hypothetical protein
LAHARIVIDGEHSRRRGRNKPHGRASMLRLLLILQPKSEHGSCSAAG